jgi:hypothetical protein
MLAALLWGAGALHAQDIITLKNGDEIKDKVQEIGLATVKYENPIGPIYALLGTEIFRSKYENGEKDVAVPDPVGTITANIAYEVSISIITGKNHGSIGWQNSDNFYLKGSLKKKKSFNNKYYNVSICNLGKMEGLGNITRIPQAGFSYPEEINSSVACESGHGYVIKFELKPKQAPVYVRLYIVGPIISTGGGIKGAMVKYQYPFVP